MIEYKKIDLHNPNSICKLKALWLDCFEEKPEAVDLFFEKNTDNVSCFCAEDGEKIVSALYLVHTIFNGRKSHYLCGASTLKNFRGRGIMSGLIEYALKSAKTEGDIYSLLFPAEEKLYDFYAKLGYFPKCTAQKIIFTRRELEFYAENAVESTEKTDFEELQRWCFKNNFLFQNNKFAEFAAEYYAMYDIKVIRKNDCLAFIEETSECADIIYSAFCDFSALARSVLEATDSEKFSFTFKAESGCEEKMRYGMIKPLAENAETPEDVYIGITLN